MPEIVFDSIGVDLPIRPDEPLPALPAIPRGAVVVIEGRAPIWRLWDGVSPAACVGGRGGGGV